LVAAALMGRLKCRNGHPEPMVAFEPFQTLARVRQVLQRPPTKRVVSAHYQVDQKPAIRSPGIDALLTPFGSLNKARMSCGTWWLKSLHFADLESNPVTRLIEAQHMTNIDD
jgi:hypothetical protein